MVSMTAWVAVCPPGQGPGERRRSLSGDQVQMARPMKGAGASGRKIAQILEVNEKTVRNGPEGGTVNGAPWPCLRASRRNDDGDGNAQGTPERGRRGRGPGRRQQGKVKAEIRVRLVSTVKERFGRHL